MEFVPRYEMSASVRKSLLIVIAIGALMTLIGLFAAMSGGHDDHHDDGHQDAHHSQAVPASQSSVGFVTVVNPEATSAEAQAEATVAADSAEAAQANEANHASDDHAEEANTAGAAHVDAHGDDHGSHHHGPKGGWLGRLWSNILMNTFLFTGVAVFGLFFLAVSYVSNAGWYSSFKRVPEAMSTFLPIGFVLLLLSFVLGKEYLYFWTLEDVRATDYLVQHKASYLNDSFFLIRLVVIMGSWIAMAWYMRKLSQREDEVGGLDVHRKINNFTPLFLIVFAVGFWVLSWDWIMSIDAHWFSTMFAVRTLSTVWVTTLAIMTIYLLHLRKQGYMTFFNKSHQHDMGKFVFAFSVFWTYIWFCEFLLIWYANIPEEGIYYAQRFAAVPITFWMLPIINFVIPFLVLMSNESKRNDTTLSIICLLMVFGHWLDMYVMVMPGTMGTASSLGLLEIGMLVLFFGVFALVTGWGLSKVNLVPKNHPMLQESLLHHYEI
jgi:hypothetical protein